MEVVSDLFERKILLTGFPKVREMARKQAQRGRLIAANQHRRLPPEGFVYDA